MLKNFSIDFGSGRVFILIPTHNRSNMLCETVLKVRKQLPPRLGQIIVIDAGSTDGTEALVKECCPSAKILKGHADMWWTATVNHGLAYLNSKARPGDRVLLMNDDIDLAPEALVRLLESSNAEPQAVIGAVNLVQRNDQELQVYSCGGQYDLCYARHKANIPMGTLWNPPAKRLVESDFLYGRLLVIPWDAFVAGCTFDEEVFPQYCADEDFTFGAKLRGFNVLIDTQSIVYVNEATTANFSLSFYKKGFQGVCNALTAFNSAYNLRQGWEFSKRYAKWPIIYILFRYLILFYNTYIIILTMAFNFTTPLRIAGGISGASLTAIALIRLVTFSFGKYL